MELLDYEKKHIDYLESVGSECTLFLKRNEEFPLKEPTKIVLVGNGSRLTIKGGTGSGDVTSRFFKTAYEGLISRGFEISSTKWLDEYDNFRKESLKDYIKDGKKLARQNHILACVYTMGFFEEEKNYDIDISGYEGDACIYVLARNSGEGNDRRCIKGDVLLSDKEVSDILYLNKKFKKFMLVLNVGGPIDLSPVMEVSNILLLSQLGVVTGDVLADIILGKTNPSGKLTTTWAKPSDYPYFNEFGSRDDTYYKEGIYVGYRYFSTLNKEVLFPFGYGLSYTEFKLETKDIKVNDMEATITVNVKNIGKYSGKEVVEAYVSKPNGILDNPSIELCGYTKTKLLAPNEDEDVSILIDFTKLGSFDTSRALTILEKGSYILHIGNSSDNLEAVAKCILEQEVILNKLANMCNAKDIKDLKITDRAVKELDLKEYKLNPSKVITKVVKYQKDKYIDPLVEKLSDSDLAYLCLGHHKTGFAAIVGSSCEHVVGGAGETVLRIKEITKSLTMADGPAGLRLKTEYGIDEKGIYDVTTDNMMVKMMMFLPKLSGVFMKPPKNRKGKIYHQYTTAIPIGTALAQSYNDELLTNVGRLIAREMKMFNVDMWLAPALNIHRNILCGRNFEYYSEDPYISGRVATAITKGVEETSGLGVVVKHFAGNNQEFNRNNNNSIISERALRDIYLKGFEYVIKEANPKGLMTSYNLINGKHTSEDYELINNIVRCEWSYDGLIMTDWIASGRSWCKKSKYPAPYASNNILAGNDLTMSGCPKDYKDIMKALKQKKLQRQDLLYSASRVYKAILRQKGND